MKKKISHPIQPRARKIRYAVIGLGHIAQTAVLPAFKKNRNSELAALVTEDNVKGKTLSRKYGKLPYFTYSEYDKLLASGLIDAIYIALPNHLHYEYADRALRRGIHVLCEKPFTLSETECIKLDRTAREHNARLMVAYRLHFERANLRAVEIASSGRLGRLRYFSSEFSFQIKDKENIRMKRSTGGGTLWDIGIYCINAARYIFQEEPIEVHAFAGKTEEDRFNQVEEMVAATLRFPDDKLASFVCSFGASEAASYEVYGTKGHLRLDKAYEYATPRELTVKTSEKVTRTKYKKCDQFKPELEYFSECIGRKIDPEPSALEGLADVRIIRALYRSIETGRAVSLERERDIQAKDHPDRSQSMRRKPVPKQPPQVHVRNPAS